MTPSTLVSEGCATVDQDGHRHYENVYLVPFHWPVNIESALPPIGSLHPHDMFARRVPIDYVKDVRVYDVYFSRAICRYTTRGK